MAAANVRYIDVPAGQEQVPVTDWDRVRVLALGMPAWDKLKENHGIDQSESPTIAVVTKLTTEGIAGSSFIAAGQGVVDIPLKRICPEASSRARITFNLTLYGFQNNRLCTGGDTKYPPLLNASGGRFWGQMQ